MYKVVVLTWYEPEYIDYDRQPWGGERLYEVVESNISWNYLLDKEYERYWLTEEDVYFAILEYKVDARWMQALSTIYVIGNTLSVNYACYWQRTTWRL